MLLAETRVEDIQIRGSQVLIERHKKDDLDTVAGQIIIPDAAIHVDRATVLAVGPGNPNISGGGSDASTADLEPGMTVLVIAAIDDPRGMRQKRHMSLRIDNRNVDLVQASDIFAIVKETE